jgi:AraC-like DNA-binding protein
VLVYIFICYGFIFRNRESFKADDLKWQWSLKLLGAMCFLWATFVLQITVYQEIIYATNVIVAALVVYILSLWAIRRAKIFLPEPKTKPDDDAYQALGIRIQDLLEREEIYIDANLTVSSLAAKLKVPAYLVSKTINHFFKRTFSELLMEYRIKKSEHLLLAPESRNYTVEAVAYESGFNTLSAFYAAFKKIHKTTPAQFRNSRGYGNLRTA